MIRRGSHVLVYRDPVTQHKLEGEAVVVGREPHWTADPSGLEEWDVVFVEDLDAETPPVSVVRRTIHPRCVL